jgi:hypothetical protein
LNHYLHKVAETLFPDIRNIRDDGGKTSEEFFAAKMLLLRTGTHPQLGGRQRLVQWVWLLLRIPVYTYFKFAADLLLAPLAVKHGSQPFYDTDKKETLVVYQRVI